MTDDNVIHFNPWTDFNDVSSIIDPADIEPDIEQLKVFLDVVFSYCDGLIPVRGFVDKGAGKDGRPNNIWIDADKSAADKLATFTNWAWREGAAVYVVPGTVRNTGEAKAEEISQMQTIVVDLDEGDISAKYAHLVTYLGTPTLLVESGGRTPEGRQKCHVWWKLDEPAEGHDLERLCRLRGEIAVKVGGDRHFRSAHQPIRVAGSVYHKGGFVRAVTILEHHPGVEYDLSEFAERVSAMPPFTGITFTDASEAIKKPFLQEVLTTPVHEGGADRWTRFEGASAAIGHYVRLVHEGKISPNEGWEAICQYNAAILRPAWPVERLKHEAERLWARHVERNGPALVRLERETTPNRLERYPMSQLLSDTSPMPADIIAPRILTPGGMMVLGGAPKVGKSDFLMSMLVHMAAGVPFLGFTPPHPLRVFYLQAEIQYHYLRERMQNLKLDKAVIKAAGDRLIVTPKLKMLLDEKGVARVAEALREEFADAPPDIICIDPIRNMFDSGKDGGGENDNAAMMFFLTERVERLREAVAPDCGIILAHHTKKINRKAVGEDPFQALSGASSLRGYYTSGLIMHRPDEDNTQRRLEIELRNGPGLRAKLIDKVDGRWIEINPMNERIIRAEAGAKNDAERDRKSEVILDAIRAEAEKGNLYTSTQFGEAFENQNGLGSRYTITDRISVLATKGFIKYRRGFPEHGYPPTRSHFGYLCVEDMRLGHEPVVDTETGELIAIGAAVLPSHYKCPQTGMPKDIENPSVWIYHDDKNV